MSPYSVPHAEPPWGRSVPGLPEDERDLAPRQDVPYECAKGHTFTVPFAAGAEPPDTFDCRCGTTARRDGAPEDTPAKTHFPGYADGGKNWEGDGHGTSPMEQLRKRRTPEEGEAILAEALAAARRTGAAR